MYQSKDKVSHPGYGACHVIDVCDMDLTGEQRRYYKLVPCLEAGTSVYVPVESADDVGLRPLISESQARCLMDSLASSGERWLPEKTERQRHYRELFAKNNIENLFSAFSTMGALIRRRQEKELGSFDKSTLQALQRWAVSEVAVATDTPMKQAMQQAEDLILQSC